MSAALLADLLKKGTLLTQTSLNHYQGLVDMLRRTDLCIEPRIWVAEGHSENITIKPFGTGSVATKLIPNSHQDYKKEYNEVEKGEFAEIYGVSVDDLLPVEEESVDITKDGVGVNYRILLNQKGRVNPYLTIRSY